MPHPLRGWDGRMINSSSDLWMRVKARAAGVRTQGIIMLKKNRPLGILLISDIVGFLTIGAGIIERSWDARIFIVYFAGGLLIVQLPILLYGLLISLKSQK